MITVVDFLFITFSKRDSFYLEAVGEAKNQLSGSTAKGEEGLNTWNNKKLGVLSRISCLKEKDFAAQADIV